MSNHIDYEEEAKYRVWWLNNTGGTVRDGLTIRDYFAIEIYSRRSPANGAEFNAAQAYAEADVLMKERAK